MAWGAVRPCPCADGSPRGIGCEGVSLLCAGNSCLGPRPTQLQDPGLLLGSEDTSLGTVPGPHLASEKDAFPPVTPGPCCCGLAPLPTVTCFQSPLAWGHRRGQPGGSRQGALCTDQQPLQGEEKSTKLDLFIGNRWGAAAGDRALMPGTQLTMVTRLSAAADWGSETWLACVGPALSSLPAWGPCGFLLGGPGSRPGKARGGR